MSGLSKISEIASAIGKKKKTIWTTVALWVAATLYSGPQIIKNLNIGGTPVAENVFKQFIEGHLLQEHIEQDRKVIEEYFKWTPHISVLISEKDITDARVMYVPEHAAKYIFSHKLPIEQRSYDTANWWIGSVTFHGHVLTKSDTGINIYPGYEVVRSRFDSSIASDWSSDANDWNVQWIQTKNPYTVLGVKINGEIISFTDQHYHKLGANIDFSNKTPDLNNIATKTQETANQTANAIKNNVSNLTSNIVSWNREPEDVNNGNEIILEPVTKNTED